MKCCMCIYVYCISNIIRIYCKQQKDIKFSKNRYLIIKMIRIYHEYVFKTIIVQLNTISNIRVQFVDFIYKT